MKVIKVTDGGGNDLFIKNIKDLPDLLENETEDWDIDFKIQISIKEMTEEEFNKLPEWDGF